MKETSMNNNAKPITILVADDDPDDRLMIKEALEEARLANGIEFVEDGVELMEYLQRRGSFADRPGPSKPDLLLLDLNMPRKDGREALQEIGPERLVARRLVGDPRPVEEVRDPREGDAAEEEAQR